MRLLRYLPFLAAMSALVGTLGLGAAPPAVAAPAQQANLLNNPSFESGLSGWIGDQILADGCGRQKPTFQTISSSVDSRRVKAGSNAAQITIAGGNSYLAWYQQTVSGITPGSRVRFTIWGHVWSTSTGADPTRSDSGVQANLKVGIEPTGNFPFASANTIVWSSLVNALDTYQQLSVETTATGSSVTVFAMSNPSFCNPWNDTYWDDASLTVVPAAPTAPAATAPPTQAVNACPKPTKFPTPTPGADGKIVYTVQTCDTMWDVAAIAGLTVEQLKALNGLTSNFVYVGQRLVLGTGAAAVEPSATPAPAVEQPTATSASAVEQPTNTAQPAASSNPTSVVGGGTPVAAATTGEVCVMLYEDANGDGTRGSGEGLLAGGKFKLTDAGSGGTAGDYTTDGKNEPHCFQNLASGNYSVEVTMPDGYNATTATTFALPLTPGGTANLEFGAQSGKGASGGGSTPSTSSSRLRTALFGAAGIIFLLLAAGVAGFLVLTQRGRRG
ncbi:MAG: LysM peptidoglycan-binding domain-containing protein [Chloroflexi bacterium]|nr:LysM peptidoglycan-binding domain-containing protein [Chloroflexota bacterium]